MHDDYLVVGVRENLSAENSQIKSLSAIVSISESPKRLRKSEKEKGEDDVKPGRKTHSETK